MTLIKKFNLFLEQLDTPNPNVIEVSSNVLDMLDLKEFDPELLMSVHDDDDEAGYAEYYWDHFDSARYRLDIYNYIVEKWFPKLRDSILSLNIGIEDIKPKGIHVNKNNGEYDLRFDFVMEDDFIETLSDYINSIKPRTIDLFFAEKWGHHEGFMSYMPQDKRDLLEFLHSGEEGKVYRGLCAFLRFAVGDKRVEKWQSDLEYDAQYKFDADTYYTGPWKEEGDEDDFDEEE